MDFNANYYRCEKLNGFDCITTLIEHNLSQLNLLFVLLAIFCSFVLFVAVDENNIGRIRVDW